MKIPPVAVNEPVLLYIIFLKIAKYLFKNKIHPE